MPLSASPRLLLLLLLLWHSNRCATESAITHASNVNKRQLQYSSNFATPNAFMHASHLLYDPGYNAQQQHEMASEMSSRSANTAVAGMMNSLATPLNFQQRSQEPRKFDDMTNGVPGLQFEAPQTFSHIYFPHVYSPSSQVGPGRTAPHVFPADTPAAMAARNSGQSYSTSSNYFMPTSVLYHPNGGPQQQHIHPHRQVQQQQQQQQQQQLQHQQQQQQQQLQQQQHQQQQHQQQLQQQQQQHQLQQQQQAQAYNQLPPPLPPPGQYQQYAPQPQPPPLPAPPPQPSPAQSHPQPPTATHEQQQSTSQQTLYQRHSQQLPSGQHPLPPPLPPLPRLPPLTHGQQQGPPPQPPPPPPPPPPLNFQAPFRPSQFLGYMQDDPRNGMPHMGGGANDRAPLYTEAYPMMAPQPLVKPIYERMRDHYMNDAAQQNYQGATTQHARYGRYIYMAPSNMYALFKAA